MNEHVDQHKTLRAEVAIMTRRGWQPVRLLPGSKMAFEKKWPDLIRTADDFQRGDNVGLRFGPESGGLVDIDLDYPTARALAGHSVFGLGHLPEFGRGSVVAGRRGHRLVVCQDAPDKHVVFAFRSNLAKAALQSRGLKLTVLELRGSNGTQSAVPPSVIAGDPLVWSDPAGCPVDVPVLSWAELNRRAGLLAFASLAAAIYPEFKGDNAFLCQLKAIIVGAGHSTSVSDDVLTAVAAVNDDQIWAPDFEPDGDLGGFLRLVDLEVIEGSLSQWLGLGESNVPDSYSTPNEAHEVVPARYSAEQLARILSALDPSDFSGYFDHRDIMFAAHHATAGAQDAREVFVAWSGRNPAFGPGQRDENGKLWSDVVRGLWNRAHADREGNVVTVGTLLHALIEAGHRDLATEFINQHPDNAFDDDPGDIADDPVGEKPHRYKRWSVTELMSMPPPNWTVEGMVLERSLVMLYGEPKSFKTFIGLDLALCVATGIAFHGTEVVAGRVCYVGAEGHARELGERVVAWCIEHEIDPVFLDGRFGIVTSGVQLDEPSSVKEFINVDPDPCEVIFFDTLNRNMSGHESDTLDMSKVVKGCDYVRRVLKTAVVLVHHSGVDGQRERGSTVLRGAVDARLRVSRNKETGGSTLLIEDSRSGPSGKKLRFVPASILVDRDKPRSTLVMRLDTSAAPVPRDVLDPQQRLLVDIYGRRPSAQVELVETGEGAKKGRSQSAVSAKVKKLIDAGYLKPDSVSLTPAGEAEAEMLIEMQVDGDVPA